tara:strand:- start:789 stop:1610 length:822 start_codon:yes stop_codon:yes gene_type:complete
MNNSNDNKLIPASTVLIIRNCESGIEVFMVVRNHQIDFASGALVFPGGKVDKEDYDARLKQNILDTNEDEKFLSYKIAAIRESFEEANVLFANDKNKKIKINSERLFKLKKWREKFNNREGSMYEFSQTENISFSTDSLIPFAHWVTPEMMPKRFDTRFYIAIAPDGHEGEHDGAESVDSVWINPKDALDDCYERKRNIIFPTRLNLEKLNQSSSVEEAINKAKKSNITTVTPVIEKDKNGSFLTIPEEAGYGEIREPLNEITTPGAKASESS